MNIPDHNQALAMLTAKQGQNPERVAHCLAVAGLARAMAEIMIANGHDLNLALVQAAALLHDIGKGQANHALAGGDYLRGLGYPEVGTVAELHGRLGGRTPSPDEPVSEAEVVFLADKCFHGPTRVTPEERYRLWRQSVAGNPERLASLAQGQERTRIVTARIEKAMGRPLEEVRPVLPG
jgi:putative nucleotidyltransferase with HDIG domain